MASNAQARSFCDALKTIVDDGRNLFENVRDKRSFASKNDIGETEYLALVHLPLLRCQVIVDEDLDIASVVCTRRVAGATLAAKATSDAVASVRSCSFTTRWNVSERGTSTQRIFTARDGTTLIDVRSFEDKVLKGIYHVMLTVENAP